MRLWGPQPLENGRWRFRLWAPDREAVTLEIDGVGAWPMQQVDGGWFEHDTDASIGARYRFRLDETLAVPDPASRAQWGGVHGWSVLVAPSERSDAWHGRPWAETVIYELHVGTCGGFAGVAKMLPDLAALGVTAIELMPVNAFEGTRNWGYDGVLPFAPAEAYGSPEDLRLLVDAAHGHGLMIFLDVVYNHFGPDGNYLGTYASSFFHADRQTPWGGAVAADRAQVAAYFRENALMWLNEYGFDGLRFDAVHAIGDDDFLDALAKDIREATGPDRHVHLMLENERNDADRLKSGGYNAQWNDDFHNVMHVLLTGETDAYYEDFSEKPAHRLAKCLEQGFIYQGDPSPHQDGKRRGTPSGHLPPTAFVSFLQNHDQVGNRAMGERLMALTTVPKMKAATALLLLMPHIPMLFMGEEVGARSPFLFFTDFHDELADAVREGRRREFKGFAAFSSEEARAKIPDPNAIATFEASKVVPGEDADEWRSFYRALLDLRRTHIVPGLDRSRALEAEPVGEQAVVASWMLGNGTRITLQINFGTKAIDPASSREALFATGTPGAAESLTAWIDTP